MKHPLGHNEDLADRILDVLYDTNPVRLTLEGVKRRLPEFSQKSKADWRQAHRKLNARGLTQGYITFPLSLVIRLSLTPSGLEFLRLQKMAEAKFTAASISLYDGIDLAAADARGKLALAGNLVGSALPATMMDLVFDRFRSVKAALVNSHLHPPKAEFESILAIWVDRLSSVVDEVWRSELVRALTLAENLSRIGGQAESDLEPWLKRFRGRADDLRRELGNEIMAASLSWAAQKRPSGWRSVFPAARIIFWALWTLLTGAASIAGWLGYRGLHRPQVPQLDTALSSQSRDAAFSTMIPLYTAAIPDPAHLLIPLDVNVDHPKQPTNQELALLAGNAAYEHPEAFLKLDTDRERWILAGELLQYYSLRSIHFLQASNLRMEQRGSKGVRSKTTPGYPPPLASAYPRSDLYTAVASNRFANSKRERYIWDHYAFIIPRGSTISFSKEPASSGRYPRVGATPSMGGADEPLVHILRLENPSAYKLEVSVTPAMATKEGTLPEGFRPFLAPELVRKVKTYVFVVRMRFETRVTDAGVAAQYTSWAEGLFAGLRQQLEK